MAKLVIYRGDALDRELDLDGRDLRIGRAEQNDVVLQDGTKAVSRLHAELRYENGAYLLVDLNSENGIWVRNGRQSTIALQPDEPVTIRPYTLMLVDPSAAVETFVGAPADHTYVGAPDNRQPPALPARASTGAPVPKHVVAALLAAVVAVAAIAVWTLRTHREPSEPVEALVDPASVPSEPSAPPATLSSEEIRRRHVEAAKSSLERGDRHDALKEIEEVLRVTQDDREALDLRNKITGSTPRTATPAPSVPPATAKDSPSIAASANANASFRGKPPAPAMPALPSPFDLELKVKYESASDAAERGQFRDALDRFAEIEHARADYPGVSDRVSSIGNSIRETVTKALGEGDKLQTEGDFLAARDQYQKANDWIALLQRYPASGPIEPSMVSKVADSFKSVRERMNELGEKAFLDGTSRFNFAKPGGTDKTTQDAIHDFEQAWQYLSDNNPKKKTARERLDELRRK